MYNRIHIVQDRDNTLVNAVMNIPDIGKQRIFSFGQAVSL